MSVKLLMNWDIKPGRDQDYFEFVVHEWIPGITKMGIEPIMAWYTVYSRDDSVPQIMAECIAEDLPTMRQILQSDDWTELHVRLSEFVDNYTHKVVRTSGFWQM
jgi:hypothetical protein